MNKIVVKIADYRIADGAAILVTFGLGSCVAVVVYDPVARIAGMGHIMLPSALEAKTYGNPNKFADMCIAGMVGELESTGCSTGRMVAKIAGGARMFDLPQKGNSFIGERNRNAVLAELGKKRIPLIAEDTGGNYGRTVEFNSNTGEMLVRSLQRGIRVI